MKSVSGKDFIKILEQRGWRFVRSRGSHFTYESPQGDQRVAVPVHGSTSLKIGMLKALMKLTGVTEQEL